MSSCNIGLDVCGSSVAACVCKGSWQSGAGKGLSSKNHNHRVSVFGSHFNIEAFYTIASALPRSGAFGRPTVPALPALPIDVHIYVYMHIYFAQIHVYVTLYIYMHMFQPFLFCTCMFSIYISLSLSPYV